MGLFYMAYTAVRHSPKYYKLLIILLNEIIFTKEQLQHILYGIIIEREKSLASS